MNSPPLLVMINPVPVHTHAGLFTTQSPRIGHAVELVVKLVGSDTFAKAQSTQSAVSHAI